VDLILQEDNGDRAQLILRSCSADQSRADAKITPVQHDIEQLLAHSTQLVCEIRGEPVQTYVSVHVVN
jgi:hypothetical protein